jgi:hypothetical protein
VHQRLDELLTAREQVGSRASREIFV